MDSWILFQLIIDIALFGIIILYIVREERPGGAEDEAAPAEAPADTEKLESLMDELAKLVVRAEKVADRIDKGSQAITAASPKEQHSPRPAAAVKENEPSLPGKVDDEAYANTTRLIKKGLPDDEISRIVGLPAHEIRLIRSMATKRR